MTSDVTKILEDLLRRYSSWVGILNNSYLLSLTQMAYYRQLFESRGVKESNNLLAIRTSYYFDVYPTTNVSYLVNRFIKCYLKDAFNKDSELITISSGKYSCKFHLIKVEDVYYDITNRKGFTEIEKFLMWDDSCEVIKTIYSAVDFITLGGRMVRKFASAYYLPENIPTTTLDNFLFKGVTLQ